MSSNLLAEINGADVSMEWRGDRKVRSILRQRRAQKESNEERTVVNEESPKVLETPKEEPKKEIPKSTEPDLLQRRKLLFVESSSSDSSDWSMSD